MERLEKYLAKSTSNTVHVGLTIVEDMLNISTKEEMAQVPELAELLGYTVSSWRGKDQVMVTFRKIDEGLGEEALRLFGRPEATTSSDEAPETPEVPDEKSAEEDDDIPY